MCIVDCCLSTQETSFLHTFQLCQLVEKVFISEKERSFSGIDNNDDSEDDTATTEASRPTLLKKT